MRQSAEFIVGGRRIRHRHTEIKNLIHGFAKRAHKVRPAVERRGMRQHQGRHLPVHLEANADPVAAQPTRELICHGKRRRLQA